VLSGELTDRPEPEKGPVAASGGGGEAQGDVAPETGASFDFIALRVTAATSTPNIVSRLEVALRTVACGIVIWGCGYHFGGGWQPVVPLRLTRYGSRRRNRQAKCDMCDRLCAVDSPQRLTGLFQRETLRWLVILLTAYLLEPGVRRSRHR
jgi:hypothetical protein